MLNKFSTGVLVAGLIVAGAARAALAAPQDSKSAPLARQLTQALDAAKIDAMAAADPTTGGFVAVLYIPGTQLLVVSGKFELPDIGTHRIDKKEFRELYMDLMGASLAGSRQFATDVSCDGMLFKAAGGAPGDTWERDNKTQVFEGAKKSKLSDEQYVKAYGEADAQYARFLELLVAQANLKI
ncbi:MAG: hypothetical protein H0W08_11715 [Acidobacteria bacterium]|nr:hypothetical protein [Acidobacteriota bacterium]